jgi:hypothetical protein
MRFNTWKKLYKPVVDEDGEIVLFQTNHKNVVFLAPFDQYVWTICTRDDGGRGEIIQNGFHYVNRDYYIMTEVPFTGTSFFVNCPAM